ncbi:MAG: GGDEF domain-containing protein [Deltaproteobacteria bacterium]|nr:GGDEF domain-containing protein [Deltaproteobacteria bacterium]
MAQNDPIQSLSGRQRGAASGGTNAVQLLGELEAIGAISKTIAAGAPARVVLTAILDRITALSAGSQAVICVSRPTLAALTSHPDAGDAVVLSPSAQITSDGAWADELRDWEGTSKPLASGDGQRLLLPHERGGIVVLDAAAHVLSSAPRLLTLQILSELSRGEIDRATKLADAERRKATLEETRARLREQNVLLREFAVVDELTGLHNRRYFERRLVYELDRVERYHRPLTLAVLDVDLFKRFNDTWGHDMGDAVLRQLSKIAQRTLRRVDLVARYGGEEFVVLMPETEAEGGRAALDRLREKIAENIFELDGQEVRVTISGGVATTGTSWSGDPQSLFRQADQALYRAKNAGRNQIVSAETKIDSAETKIDSAETKIDSAETEIDSAETDER